MVLSYRSNDSPDLIHQVVAGGYKATLQVGPTEVKVAKIDAAASPAALARPAAASDQAAMAAVGQAMARCAAATKVAVADCPQLAVVPTDLVDKLRAPEHGLGV